MKVRALIFAAGLGTRLHPLSDELAKPLVPIANKPALWFALTNLQRAGLREAVVNTHAQAAKVLAALQSLSSPSLTLTVSHEATLLGTAGGLRQARALTAESDEPWLTTNADALVAVEIAKFMAVHALHQPAATLLLRANPDPVRYSPIWLEPDGRVSAMLRDPRPSTTARCMMYTGTQILGPTLTHALPETGCIIRHVVYAAFAGGQVIRGHEQQGLWADIGTPSDCWAANIAFAQARWHWPDLPASTAQGIIDTEATVATDAKLESCVIAKGASVGRRASLQRVVLWPNANLDAGTHLSDAIVTPNQVLSCAARASG